MKKPTEVAYLDMCKDTYDRVLRGEVHNLIIIEADKDGKLTVTLDVAKPFENHALMLTGAATLVTEKYVGKAQDETNEI